MEREPDTGEMPESPSAPLRCCAFEHDERARERLLRVAADVFDRKGYASASVREIVEQAGITKPVLYYHYGSKEGMLIAILEEAARRVKASLARAVALPGTARERLVALCDEMYGLFRENMAAVRVAHAVFFGPREALPDFDFGKFDIVLADAITAIVADGMASGELRRVPVADVVTAINGVIALFTDIELTPNVKQLTIDDIHRVLDLIFEGLLPAREKEN